MKSIYLDSTGNSVCVPDEVYAQIELMVRKSAICEICKKPYTADNPQVTQNRCKDCFLVRFGQTYSLSYVGEVSSDKYGEPRYAFVSEHDGWIFVTWSSLDASQFSNYYRSIRGTLKYWGYPDLPQTYTWKGEENFIGDQAEMYGDPRSNQTILLTYTDRPRYSNVTIDLLFLATKGGEIREIDKKRGEGRKLWLEAKKQAEACKRPNGSYVLDGQTYYQLCNWMLCPIIVKIVNQ